MRRILSSRVFRCLVCLILVCSILVLSSPIRAEALVTELTLAEWGLIAIATLLAAGITINIVEQFELEAMGNVFKTHMANAAKKQQLDEDILDITFGIVLVDDTPNKKVPFNSNPGDFGWSILGVLSFLELFSRLGDETIPVKAPSFGTVAEGEIVSHGQYGYEVVSSTAPVYYYIWCSPRTSSNRHTTVFYSSDNFNVSSSSSHSITTNETTRNGVNAFYAYENLGWDGSCTQCSFHLEAQTLEEVRLYVCSLLADGEPTSELSATIVDDTVQAALQGATVIDSINVPDIDLSSISSLSAITGINNSLSNGELSFEDLLKELTGGETITVNPGSGIDPDPGTGTNPDPGTGTNPDPGTGTDPGTDSGSSSWQPPSDPTQFQLVDLSKFFPFCIPFDLFEFFKLLNSDPVAPVLHWEIQDLAGQTYSLTVDLSEWDSVALLFRRLQLFLFVTGLAAASRKFIKW